MATAATPTATKSLMYPGILTLGSMTISDDHYNITVTTHYLGLDRSSTANTAILQLSILVQAPPVIHHNTPAGLLSCTITVWRSCCRVILFASLGSLRTPKVLQPGHHGCCHWKSTGSHHPQSLPPARHPASMVAHILCHTPRTRTCSTSLVASC